MEELAAGQKPGGAEERGEGSQFAYFSNCPLSFPSPLSASLGTCRSCPFFFYACRPLSFSTHSAVTLLSVCISRAASFVHGHSGSRGSYKHCVGPAILSLEHQQRERRRGGKKRISIAG